MNEWHGIGPPKLISEEEVRKVTRDIPSNKAPGPDGIPGKAVKLLVRNKADAVSRVLNKCLKQGIFRYSGRELDSKNTRNH